MGRELPKVAAVHTEGTKLILQRLSLLGENCPPTVTSAEALLEALRFIACMQQKLVAA